MEHPAKVDYREGPGASLLTAADDLGGARSQVLARELRRTGQRRLLQILDLRAVTRIGTPAVALLLTAQARARREGRCFWVLPSPAVREAVEAAGVTGLVAFASADDVDGWLPSAAVAD